MNAQGRPKPLLDFIPLLSPRQTRPEHLAPVAELFERARREVVFAFVTAPPRHGKTELLKHGITHRLLAEPSCRVAYGSYAAKRAQKVSRELRDLYKRAGGPLARGASSVGDWRTGVETGGLWANGVGGQWTGEGFDLTVVDDPISGRAEAESGVEREKLWEWFNDDLCTRWEPGGSIIVFHTRWTIDDLGARMLAHGVRGRKVEHIHLPALSDDGHALWPARFPLEELERIKSSNPYRWASLYQGRPFARGGRVFHDCHLYTELPPKLRYAIGIDLAFTAKTSADWSAIVVLGIDDAEDRIYVVEVTRAQKTAPEFAAVIREVQGRYGQADARWYYAGAEKGIVDFARTMGVDVDAMPATLDKFVRAQPVAGAWNAGRILVPKDAKESPWVDDFVTELVAFTGHHDLHDDQVDAFAGAFDSSEQPGWVTMSRKLRAEGGTLSVF